MKARKREVKEAREAPSASTNTSPQHRKECTTPQTVLSPRRPKRVMTVSDAFLPSHTTTRHFCPTSAMTSIGHAYVAKSSVAGSGLFALQDIAAGDLIFSLARPAVAALDTKNLGNVCANCFASAADPSVLHGEANAQVLVKACTGCKILKYCSKVSAIV